MGVKIVTRLVRFSYANVWHPREDDHGNMKYSIALLFPKKNENAIRLVQEAIDEALTEGKNKGVFGKKDPGTFKKKNTKMPNFKWLLRDGDDQEDKPEYEDMMYLNASSNEQPLLGDADRQEIVDEDEFYSGCWGRACVVISAFNRDGNMGITAYLHSLQKLREGEKLSGRDSLENAFADTDDIDEQELSIIGGYANHDTDSIDEEDLDADDIL